jgi:type I restriction enzyme M protein
MFDVPPESNTIDICFPSSSTEARLRVSFMVGNRFCFQILSSNKLLISTASSRSETHGVVSDKGRCGTSTRHAGEEDTRVVTERPLRLRFEITDERLAEFQKSGFFTGLVLTKKVGHKAKAEIAKGEEKQRAIIAALEKAKALCPCRDDRVFQQFVNDALPFKATGQLVTALRAAFGETDEKAEKVLLKPLGLDFDTAAAEAEPGDWYQTDAGLRDEERIPLKTDIDAYFFKEVLPYARDAWMDRSKDKIGYEISFTKYFYEYQPPRALRAILSDLEALDAEADELQAELRA